MKRIYKYGTGDAVPEGATFLGTVTQTTTSDGYPCWLVWHYFLIEVAS